MPVRKNPRILLVEDSAELRDVTSAVLTEAGYDVTGLGDGHEAIRHVIVDKRKPDVIILDLMMPKVTGLEFLAVRATNEHAKKIPVIVLSAMPLEGALPKDTLFLAKPVRPGALAQSVAAVLARKPKAAAKKKTAKKKRRVR